jgi:UDP-N-acetylmuramyl tripeptide synthase
LLSELESVSGRFQYIVSSTITAIVDYAHTWRTGKRFENNESSGLKRTINYVVVGKTGTRRSDHYGEYCVWIER